MRSGSLSVTMRSKLAGQGAAVHPLNSLNGCMTVTMSVGELFYKITSEGLDYGRRRY